MTLYGKTIFDKACGASSKSDFSDFHFKAPYVPNKTFFFQGLKNHSEADYAYAWTVHMGDNVDYDYYSKTTTIAPVRCIKD